MTSMTDPWDVGDAFSIGEFRYCVRCRYYVQSVNIGLPLSHRRKNWKRFSPS